MSGRQTDALVLCTRNRPGETEACLASLRRQSIVPAEVCVVDSSERGATASVVAALATDWPATSRLWLVSTTPGLVHQRSVGIAESSGDIVHFVDDDTVLEPGYIAGIHAAFASDRAIVGVGGFITNQPVHRFSIVDEILGLDSRHQGSILASGRNVRVYDEPEDLHPVSWLPGAAMSFVRWTLEREPPDERVDDGRNGEDVHLSGRVGRLGRLVVSPRARLAHLESAIGRRDAVELVPIELLSRYERVVDGIGDVSRRAFWVSAWGQLGWYALKGFASMSPERLRIARASARGIANIRRSARPDGASAP